MMTTKFCKRIEVLFTSLDAYAENTALFLLNKHKKSEAKAYEKVDTNKETGYLVDLEMALKDKNLDNTIQELEKLKKAKMVVGSPVLCLGTGKIYGNTISKLKKTRPPKSKK